MIERPVVCRPFIGRLDELAYLRERRLEAGSSHGGFVLVAGDAGVGKSRLISECCSSLAYSRWRIGAGACVEFASRPYGPILEILAKIDPARFELGAAKTKREQFDAIVERIAGVAARKALLLVVEDLHWADVATLDLLTYLGPRIERMRVLVLVSFRSDELHAEHPAINAIARISRGVRAGRIDLAPLRGIDLQRFIDEALTGFDLPEPTRRAIALAGEGNPFFTEELLKSAVERRFSHRERGRNRELPQTVEATLLERLRPFDEGERLVVAQAAVIGRTFGLDLLATTLETEPERLIPVLRRARDFQLVEEVAPSVFRFRHGLTRDAIYARFLGAELQPRHRGIALALENADPEKRALEGLAYHWWAAGDADRAARYNELAGDAASAVHAHEDAIAFYERALESAAGAAARGNLAKKIADRRLSLGWTKEAHASYCIAADLFRDARAHEREAGCRATAAITAYGTGLPNPTGPLEAMLARLDESEYLARSRVHLGLAWLFATFWFPTQASQHLALVDPQALDEAPDIALRFYNVSAFVAMTLGDLDRFRSEHDAWVRAGQASGSLPVLAGAYTNGAMCYAFFGLHEEAQSNLDQALTVSRAARSSHSEESVHAFAALCYLLRGDLESARTALGYVEATSENRVNLTFATAWGTIIGAALDDQRLIEKWFDGFEATVVAAPEVECGGGFAEVMVRRGRQRDAAALLARALPDCELLRGNVFTLLAVGRYGAAADRDRARTYLARAAAARTELMERPALALFDAMAARRDGNLEQATSLARTAADGFRRLRFPLFEAAALEEAKDTDAAIATFRRCGATFDVSRLEATREVVEGKPVAGSAESAVLSGREREVAVLAAAGRSNLEIASELSITYKTVEKHLGSTYRKLGLTSRAQLRRHFEHVLD